jgi:hypothetical protein
MTTSIVITCIVSTLGLTNTFSYNATVVLKESANSTFHFVGLGSTENYWSVRDREGREVTFFPECFTVDK